jgi:hypothetical protein
MKDRFFLNFPVHAVSFILLLGSVSGFSQSKRSVTGSHASFNPASEFNVMVDGKNVLVYSSPIPAAFCSFVMDNPVKVVVKSLTRDVKWADVRPLSAGIKPVINKDSTITFRIDKPGKFSIELNGSFKIPLFLFANAPEENGPERSDKNVLYFEAGKIHYPGTINLRDNQQVYIEGGAIVAGNIKANMVSHIKVYGQGILDGSYDRRFMDSCAVANRTNLSVNFPDRGKDINRMNNNIQL